MTATISFLVLCFSVVLGFTSPSFAGDEKPTLGDDGLYHYNWYHQSFFELADELLFFLFSFCFPVYLDR